MSDKMAESLTPESNGGPETPKPVVLSVTLYPSGRIEYNLPNNKVMAWGLLGAAQEQLTKMEVMGSLAQVQAHAQAARGGLAGLRQRMTGRG